MEQIRRAARPDNNLQCCIVLLHRLSCALHAVQFTLLAVSMSPAGEEAQPTWKQTCGRPGSSKTWSVGMRSRMQRASLTAAACRAAASASSGIIAIARGRVLVALHAAAAAADAALAASGAAGLPGAAREAPSPMSNRSTSLVFYWLQAVDDQCHPDREAAQNREAGCLSGGGGPEESSDGCL